MSAGRWRLVSYEWWRCRETMQLRGDRGRQRDAWVPKRAACRLTQTSVFVFSVFFSCRYWSPHQHPTKLTLGDEQLGEQTWQHKTVAQTEALWLLVSISDSEEQKYQNVNCPDPCRHRECFSGVLLRPFIISHSQLLYWDSGPLLLPDVNPVEEDWFQ